MKSIRLLALGCAALMAATPLLANADPGRGRGHGGGPPAFEDGHPGRGHGGDRDDRGRDRDDFSEELAEELGSAAAITLASAFFSPRERDLIYDYFDDHRFEPQGLPPGIARNLARGKPLPPGIAKRYLPSPLLAQLPRRDGYEYLIVGGSIILAEAATGLIVDILEGAL